MCHAAVSPHLYTLTYMQAQCCLPLKQLHSNLGISPTDFVKRHEFYTSVSHTQFCFVLFDCMHYNNLNEYTQVNKSNKWPHTNTKYFRQHPTNRTQNKMLNISTSIQLITTHTTQPPPPPTHPQTQLVSQAVSLTPSLINPLY